MKMAVEDMNQLKLGVFSSGAEPPQTSSRFVSSHKLRVMASAGLGPFPKPHSFLCLLSHTENAGTKAPTAPARPPLPTTLS